MGELPHDVMVLIFGRCPGRAWPALFYLSIDKDKTLILCMMTFYGLEGTGSK